MMKNTGNVQGATGAGTHEQPSDTTRKWPWTALVFIAAAQLVLSLDIMVVNIALPTIQGEMGLADDQRQWVMAGYSMTYGACLLVGGRLCDIIGLRRSFMIGLIGLGLTSLAVGLAPTPEFLIVARVLQGLSGALLSPSALSLVNALFTEQRVRAKALGVYSAVSSGGMVLGLVLGGLITQYLGWRWAFFLTLFVAILAFIGGRVAIPNISSDRPRRFDVPGALLSALGLTGIVVLASQMQLKGITDPSVLLLLALVVALVAGFIVVEHRARVPLMPLELFTSRPRMGAYIANLCGVMGMFGLMLLVTFYLQDMRGFSPLVTGLGFFPLLIALAIGATQIAGRFTKVSPGALVAVGYGLAILAVLLLTRLVGTSQDNWILIMASLLLGLGLGMSLTTCTSQATAGVQAGNAGVASALLGVMQMIGAALGAVVLNGAAVQSTNQYLEAHPGVSANSPEAVMAGYVDAQYWAAGLLLIGVLAGVFLIGRGFQNDAANSADGLDAPTNSQPSTTTIEEEHDRHES